MASRSSPSSASIAGPAAAVSRVPLRSDPRVLTFAASRREAGSRQCASRTACGHRILASVLDGEAARVSRRGQPRNGAAAIACVEGGTTTWCGWGWLMRRTCTASRCVGVCGGRIGGAASRRPPPTDPCRFAAGGKRPRAEGTAQKAEGTGQKAEEGTVQKAEEGTEQKAQGTGRRQKADGRRQEAGGSRQRAAGGRGRHEAEGTSEESRDVSHER